jgi:hypothetical protein
MSGSMPDIPPSDRHAVAVEHDGPVTIVTLSRPGQQERTKP